MNTSILILLTFLHTATMLSKPLPFERITTKEGLSQNSVTSICQDKTGFIWFGTQDGLNRYDGYNFKFYRHDPENPESLSDYAINVILEDLVDPKILWIGTREGLNRFDREKETFTHFRHHPDQSGSLSNNQVRSLYFSRDGILWIGTDNGLNRFHRETDSFTRYDYDPDDEGKMPFPIASDFSEDKEGNLWISGHGLCLFDRKNNRFINYQQDSNDEFKLNKSFITRLYRDRHGVLWAGLYYGILRINEETKHDGKISLSYYKVNPELISNGYFSYVKTFYEDRQGKLWIGFLSGGLLIFDPGKSTFIEYPLQNTGELNAAPTPVLSIMEDNSGIIWLGTNGQGAVKYNTIKKSFKVYRHIPDDPQSILNDEIQAVYEDNNGVWWIGTSAGMSRFDKSLDEFRHFLYNPKGPSALSSNDIQSIFQDRRGNLWVGTFGGGLNKSDNNSGKFENFKHETHNPISLSNNYIHAIYEDKNGDLWIGTGAGGLDKYDYETSSFNHYQQNPDKKDWLKSSEINCIVEDRSGSLWLGTTLWGIYRFDSRQEIFKNYMHDLNDPSSLSSNRVISIFQDKSQNLWIGTYGGGLNRFNYRSGTFTHFTSKDGLAGNTVYGILEDDHRNIWLGTENGISKFDPQSKIFRNYYSSDGLPSNQFSIAACKLGNGSMLFGTDKGLVRFHPDSIRDDSFVPPVVLTDFRIFNESVPVSGVNMGSGHSFLHKSISESDEINIYYGENVFTFEFSALHYAAPFKNQYMYKMEGFDRDWIYSGNHRYATYTNLDPGTYIFKVKGSNSDGLWNERATSITVNILPPWWMTLPAYFIYLVIFLLILYMERRYEMNRIKIRNQLRMKDFETRKLQEIDHLKSQFFANISHEFRTPLTLILGPLESIMSGIKDKNISNHLRLIKRNADRLLNLINQILDLSRLESGQMTLKVSRGNLITFLRGIVMSFASLAEQHHIELIFKSGIDTGGSDLYFDADKTEKIFSNLLSNAFKYTNRGGKVEISVKAAHFTASGAKNTPGEEERANKDYSDYLLITVFNSGSYIPPNEIEHIFDRFYQVESPDKKMHYGTGIGLALVRQLVIALHGDITVQSKEHKGTSFLVNLPCKADHFSPEEIIDHHLSGRENEPLYLSDDLSSSLKNAKQTKLFNNKNKDRPLVLVIEDHSEVRRYIIDYLNPYYTLIEANDGEEGIKLAAEQIPDLIISDVMMPNMDGFDLCVNLKTDPKTSHIPIILLTARAGDENKVKGLETGADDYLIKPFNPPELQTRVRNLIEQRRKLRERFHREGFLLPLNLPVNSAEQNFLKKLRKTLDDHIEEEQFGIDVLCQELAMSARQLQRKIRALTGESPTDLIRSARLERAKYLLEKNSGSVSEIAFNLGFNNLSYFARTFRERFGMPPSKIGV
ncbi:MAG: response regulator [Calditrichaceae bacterium]|nr:response regulator [Calditrichaceae bacterium]RQV94060.1 MAG: hybrid sensor histidine kinase/response regulator [Calditrichota bacterium]